MKKLIILGASGASLDILSIVEDINEYGENKIEFLGFYEDRKEKVKKNLHKLIIGNFQKRKIYKDVNYITALGNEKNFFFRDKIINQLEIPLRKYANIVHPQTTIHKSVKIGFGNVMHSYVNVGRSSKIGNHCVFLPKSTLSHDSVLGSYSIVSSHVIISGNTKIGKLCYFGAGTSLRDGINITSKVLTGVGSVVVKNINKPGFYYGVPSKQKKKI
jgi:sugar O-acyltransferase (sialic acid O-acetyltransferase NeuD family)